MTAIRTENLSKSFGQTKALIALDLEVPEGEVIGYLGPNGSGKTTTIRLLLGLIRATAGRAQIFGVDCQADPVAAHRHLAYVPGEVSLWPSLTAQRRRRATSTACSCAPWPRSRRRSRGTRLRRRSRRPGARSRARGRASP